MLLAFDTSSPTVSVAVHDGDRVVAEQVSAESMRHGEQLMPLIAACMAEAGATPDRLTAVAVGVGPGPFTGLRVGLVTARTLAHVRDIPVHGVCSLDVIAVEAVATGSVDGTFTVATDARRKEVYLACYDATARRLSEPDVRRPADVASTGAVVGEGGLLYPSDFPDSRGPHRPSAGWLARAVQEGRVSVGAPDPMYLRRPDAVVAGPRKPVS